MVDDHLQNADPKLGDRKKPGLAVGVEKLKLSDKMQSGEVQSPMKVKKNLLPTLQTSSFEMKP